jgi:glycosyltransferase involved in cell wall biosynthesis
MKTTAEPDESLRVGKKHLVGYIGVMGNADGVDYLVRAADHIVKMRQRTDVQFLLMGSGPEHAELLKLRDQLCLQEHIRMPGRVSDEFLCRALRSIDLGVACDPINAYNDHCTMNKVLEYMAFAKPIVMFGTVEGRFSAGDGAVYVMENSAEQLGDAILTLLDDESRRQTLAAAGHTRLTQELNWERSVEQLLAAYRAA